MDQLIETIRAAVANSASPEQKAAGVQACRTIAAALGTEPGKPLVLPGMPSASPTASLSVDQVLDMVIAKLSTIATERDKAPVQTLPPPTGLRVPAALAVPRPQVTRPATKPVRKATSTRKP